MNRAMAAPKFAPGRPARRRPRATSRPTTCPTRGRPTARPRCTGRQPSGARLGFQGPDQGYALTLAARLRPEVHVQAGESVDDALSGCTAIALRRASLYGRAPVIHDLRIAFTIWGFLDPTPPAELVAVRRPAVRGRRQRAAPLRASAGRSSTRSPRRRCG